MPPTLADEAATLEATARQLLDEGQGDAAARVALAACAAWRGVTGLLTAGEHSPKIRAMAAMTAEHREAISRGKTTHPMMKAARKRGFRSQVEVAAALGMKPNFLSAILSGDKKMPPDKAELLYEKTGYRWPSP